MVAKKQIDWHKGFKIESDGTCEGTKIYNHKGDPVGWLKRFVIDFDADKLQPIITSVEYEIEKKQVDYTKYKVRVCRGLHDCAVCDSCIHLGESYYDGGYGRRAHVSCPPVQCTCGSCEILRKERGRK